MDLLTTWASWREGSAPHVLDADRPVLLSGRSERSTIVYTDWPTVIAAEDFAKPGDERLHLGLLPEPFCGNLRTASIYVLLLNPGLGPTDYFGELQVPAFRAARLRNLQQAFGAHEVPFYMLDPQFAWHGGFAWWHRKFAAVIQEIQRRRHVPYAAAQRALASELASIELVPYHSSVFRDADRWLQRLRSVELARQFVQEFVLPRVRRREAIVIATRQVSQWNLPTHPGVITYSNGQARGAHLTPNSPGGRAILDWLQDSRVAVQPGGR